MDEHQRRICKRIIQTADAYESGDLTAMRLGDDLRGLIQAVDFHDESLARGLRESFTEVDMEVELRTEPWAPPGAADDARMGSALAAIRRSALSALARASDEHE